MTNRWQGATRLRTAAMAVSGAGVVAAGVVAAAAGLGGATGCGTPSVKAGVLDDGGVSSSPIQSDGAPEPEQGHPPMCNGPTTLSYDKFAIDPAKMAPGVTMPIPGGAFDMGCNAAVDPECRDDEKPTHSVNVDAFEMDKLEITQAQFFACVKDGKCVFPKCDWDPCAQPDLPMGCVKHEQAAGYCAYVGKRLPSEAEWEKAARGTDGRKYPWGNDPIDCTRANLLGCGNVPTAVGTHPTGASPFGVEDLAGNVVEWTSDWYDPGYYAASPPSNPHGPDNGTAYSGRGGGFLSEEIWQRTSSRDLYEPSYFRVSMGIRCAK